MPGNTNTTIRGIIRLAKQAERSNPGVTLRVSVDSTKMKDSRSRACCKYREFLRERSLTKGTNGHESEQTGTNRNEWERIGAKRHDFPDAPICCDA